MLTVDLDHLSGDLHAKVIQKLVLMVIENLETLLDLVRTNLGRLACKLDHVSCLPLVQFLDVALTLYCSKHIT
jgi:hypothetical protein